MSYTQKISHNRRFFPRLTKRFSVSKSSDPEKLLTWEGIDLSVSGMTYLVANNNQPKSDATVSLQVGLRADKQPIDINGRVVGASPHGKHTAIRVLFDPLDAHHRNLIGNWMAKHALRN